jgi:hypothetical protein
MRVRGLLMAGLAVSLSLAVYAAPNWRSLTDAPRDLQGQGYDRHRPLEVKYAGGDFAVLLPSDDWVYNASGAMGADNEYFHETLGARLGVWAGPSIAGKQPRALVSEWVGNIKQITGGEWTAPKTTTIAGVPVVQATGYDVYGNYAYRVVAFNRFGQNVALATRIPYEERWNRQLDEDITSIVTESHLTTQGLNKQLRRKRPR